MTCVYGIDDRSLKVSRLDSVYGKACVAAGLAYVRMPDLRHSFVSHPAAMSELLPAIRELLGALEISNDRRVF